MKAELNKELLESGGIEDTGVRNVNRGGVTKSTGGGEGQNSRRAEGAASQGQAQGSRSASILLATCLNPCLLSLWWWRFH